MEADVDANGVPDCWYLAGFGANTPTWSRTGDAHAGSFAEQVTVANWTSGDRKAIQPFDQGTCAPAVTPGRSYRAGEWFRSSAPVRFVAYTRSASGAWAFWRQSGFTPAAAGWTYATWSPPAIPAGATAISIGLSIASNGTASFDDLDLRENLTPDPGFEVDADANGVPDCWYLAGYGANTPTWSRTGDAHTGSFAEQVTIASWTSGDRKAIQPFDQGTCAPAVTPGHSYQTGEWFRSSAPVRFVAYTRGSSGGWAFWRQSAFTPAAAGWTYATWSPPAIPAGATAISIGLSIASNGSASFDDLQLVGTG
jgi:hypothetical protein